MLASGLSDWDMVVNHREWLPAVIVSEFIIRLTECFKNDYNEFDETEYMYSYSQT